MISNLELGKSRVGEVIDGIMCLVSGSEGERMLSSVTEGTIVEVVNDTHPGTTSGVR